MSKAEKQPTQPEAEAAAEVARVEAERAAEVARVEAERAAEVAALKREAEGLNERIEALEAERAEQHRVVMDLHARLTEKASPVAVEKVITAPNVRNYGG